MAATTQSTQRAAQVAAAADFNDRTDDSRDVSGAIQYAFIDVATTADNAADDVIDLYELPAGAMVIPEKSFIQVTDDMTSGVCTFDIGDAADADRYCDGADVASTGEVKFLSAAIPAAYSTRLKVAKTGTASTNTALVQLTIATMGATIEAGAFRVVLAYKTL